MGAECGAEGNDPRPCAAPGAAPAAEPVPGQVADAADEAAVLALPPASMTAFKASAMSLGERRGKPQLDIERPAVWRSRPRRRLAVRRLDGPEGIEDLYELEEKLWAAGFHNEVFRATCRATSQDVIVKMRPRKFAVGGEKVFRSLLERMLNLERHHHVLGLYDILEDDDMYYIVMERCSGGELFDFLQSATDVPENECKRIMREILQAVDHIHSRGLIHRDIKPENIMFHDTSADPMTPKPVQQKKSIKLIDFDTCQEYEPTSPKARHIVGTIGYIAPEALHGEYSPASDLWSVGVILYILMTGSVPFEPEIFEENPSDTRCGSAPLVELYSKLKDTEVDFECEPWPSFPQARELCQELLAFAPGDRSPSAQHALDHPWLNE